MKRRLVAGTIAVWLLPCLILAAETASASKGGSGASGFVLSPAQDIILTVGEQIELSVVDSRTQNPADVQVTWFINSRAADQADQSDGVLTGGGGKPVGVTATYRAPGKVPANRTVAIEARGPASTGTALQATVTIADAPNWFAIDGDTGVGQQNVAIQLDPKVPSEAGFGISPLKIAKDAFEVHISGNKKGGPRLSVTVGLALGPNSQPGTYPWRAGRPFVGATVAFSDKLYLSVETVGDRASLAGSTTILKPDATDPPGLVKGFYSGKLTWVEAVGKGKPDFRHHYLTVKGHFAVASSKSAKR